MADSRWWDQAESTASAALVVLFEGRRAGKVGCPGAVVARPHTGSVTNPTGNWALQNLPAFEELYMAIEQMSLEAGAAGDSVKETGSLEEAAPSSTSPASASPMRPRLSVSARRRRMPRAPAILPPRWTP